MDEFFFVKTEIKSNPIFFFLLLLPRIDLKESILKHFWYMINRVPEIEHEGLQHYESYHLA